MTTKELLNKYPYIVAWMKYANEYVDDETTSHMCQLAEETNAPLNATWYDDTNKVWHTTDNFKNRNGHEKLDEYLEQPEQDFPEHIEEPTLHNLLNRIKELEERVSELELKDSHIT